MFNQYPYSIFNQTMLRDNVFFTSSFDNYHNEQMQYIMEMRKAIADYCRAARKVQSDYQQIALEHCLQEIILQSQK